MATLAQDDFDRANNDSLGANWTESSGDYDIDTNRAKATNAAIATWAGTFNPASADYDVQADVEKTVTVGASGICGRFTDTSNFYYLDIHTFSQTLRLRKVVAGSDTSLGTYGGGQSNGNVYTIKLSMAGSAIKGYQAGTERISVSDSGLTSTGVPGLKSDSGNAWANNFIVTGTEAGGSTFFPSRRMMTGIGI